MKDEQNLLDQVVGYFAQYGEPTDFTGIRDFLAKRRDSLREETKKRQAELDSVTLTNLITNKTE